MSEALEFSEFLSGTPIGGQVPVRGLREKLVNGQDLAVGERPFWAFWVAGIETRLHCFDCNIEQPWEYTKTDRYKQTLQYDSQSFYQLSYQCKACERQQKIYWVRIQATESGLLAQKVGEWPGFVPRLAPQMLNRLSGEDRDAFFRGVQCLNQGLGIGAYAYFRRIVENLRLSLLQELLKMADRFAAEKSSVESVRNSIRSAIEERRFTEGLAKAKGLLGDAVYKDAWAYLSCLHDCASEGLHGKSDDECARLANDIQRVLVRLVELIREALNNHTEVDEAYKRLVKRHRDAEAPGG